MVAVLAVLANERASCHDGAAGTEPFRDEAHWLSNRVDTPVPIENFKEVANDN